MLRAVVAHAVGESTGEHADTDTGMVVEGVILLNVGLWSICSQTSCARLE